MMDMRLFVWASICCLTCFALVSYQGFVLNSLYNSLTSNSLQDFWTFTAVDVVLAVFLSTFLGISLWRSVKIRAAAQEAAEALTAPITDSALILDVLGPILAWLLYLIAQGFKTVIIYSGFANASSSIDFDADVLPWNATDAIELTYIADEFKWGIFLTATIFFVIALANLGEGQNRRNAYLVAGTMLIFFDFLDTTTFVDICFDLGYQKLRNVSTIRVMALVIYCLSLCFPLYAVSEMMRTRFGVCEIYRNFEVTYFVSRMILVDIPLVVLRSIAAHYQLFVVGQILFVTRAFLVKNCVSILASLWLLCQLNPGRRLNYSVL